MDPRKVDATVRRLLGTAVAISLLSSPALAATKSEEPPAREMLRLMELLRDWEMIKNIDLMRDLKTLEQTREVSGEQDLQGSRSDKKKDPQR